MREEDGVATGDEEDDEGAWEGWDIESDLSEESSYGWLSVDSDSDNDIEVSDSEDEADKTSTKKSKGKGKQKAGGEDSDAEMGENTEETEETPEDAVKRISTLATTKVRLAVLRSLYLHSNTNGRFSHLRISHFSMTCASRLHLRL